LEIDPPLTQSGYLVSRAKRDIGKVLENLEL